MAKFVCKTPAGTARNKRIAAQREAAKAARGGIGAREARRHPELVGKRKS